MGGTGTRKGRLFFSSSSSPVATGGGEHGATNQKGTGERRARDVSAIMAPTVGET